MTLLGVNSLYFLNYSKPSAVVIANFLQLFTIFYSLLDFQNTDKENVSDTDLNSKKLLIL